VLEEMRIRGLGVIDDAVLPLAPGLTAISGETGAGKTMLVTGLNLLFGGRADSGAVRSAAGPALVEGRLRVGADSAAARRAVDAGGELDDDSLLISRSVSGEGRSRAYVGGRAVPVAVLAELAESCVAVHGQSDQSRLLQPARQRDALDRYAGTAVGSPLRRYGAAYAELREADERLGELTTRSRERAQEADLLRFGLEEVEAVAPVPGEDIELATEEERLGHADALRAAASGAALALLADSELGGGGPDADVSSLVAVARASLEQAGAHDPQLEALGVRVREIGYLAVDVAADLASYAAGLDADPLRLATVQERRAALSRLTRKYGESAVEVLAWAQQAASRLTDLEGDDDRIAVLQARRSELLAEMGQLAQTLSRARGAAATRFAAAVSGELEALAMPQARIEIEVRQTESPSGLEVDGRTLAFGPLGVDDVEMQLCPHPGAPARPLQRGASGGELSRVMLAVEVVFAGTDPVPTLVFDEVDAGVGGKAAVEVGRRLALLARSTQVLVVTHLPQVAAFADQHLVVRKTVDGSVTSSGVTVLDDAERLQELSRMLAGIEESAAAHTHASELLEVARASKQA
jgi:DNA repair protein RecN (Recombination protein N)